MITSKFLRNVGVLVSGTAGAQLLLLAVSPILTRLFTPEDFGMLAVFSALLSFFAVVACFRYEMAIPLPSEDKEAVNILFLSLMMTLISGGICSMFILFLGEPISAAIGLPEMQSYLWLLPIGVVFAGGYQALTFWAIRNEGYRDVTISRLLQVVGVIFVQVLGYKSGVFSLVLGQSSGQGIGFFSLLHTNWRRISGNTLKLSDLYTCARRYSGFPLYSTWAALFNVVGAQLPTLLLVSLFGGAAAGYYSLAQRILSTPISVVGNAIGNVFFSSASELYKAGSLGIVIEDLHVKLSYVALPLAVTFIFLAPNIFVKLFGHEWHPAGVLSQLIMPWLYLVFITGPLSVLYEVIGRQKEQLVFQGFMLFLRIIAITLGAYFGGLYTAIALFSVASSISWLWYLFRINYLLGNSIKKMLVQDSKIFLYVLFFLAPLFALFSLNVGGGWAGGLVFFAILGCGNFLIQMLKQFKSTVTFS